MSEVTYELTKPFEYAYKGDTPEAGFITLAAPTFKQMKHLTPIKQAFMSAINEISKSDVSEAGKADDADDEITASGAMQVLYMWSGNLVGIQTEAQEMFKHIALIDGETKLTTPLMEKMAPEDFDGLLGTYIANFIAPSLMDGAKKSTG